MAKSIWKLLMLLLFKSCSLINCQERNLGLQERKVEKIPSNPGAFDLKGCEEGLTHLFTVTCNRENVTEDIVEIRFVKIDSEPEFSPGNKFFICEEFKSIGGSKKVRKIMEIKHVNVSICIWVIQHRLLNSSCSCGERSRSCIQRLSRLSTNYSNSPFLEMQQCRRLFSCVCIGDGFKQVSNHSTDSVSQCQKYPTTEVAYAVCGFLLVMALFALHYDSAIVRLLLVITLVTLALVLHAKSWMYFFFLLVFTLLFIFTGSHMDSGISKGFLFYFQTLSAMFPIDLDIGALATLLGFNNSQFLTLDCVFPDVLIYSENKDLHRFIFSVCSPFVLLIVILFFILFKTFVRCWFGYPQDETPIKCQFAFVFIFIAYFSFFNASSLVFSALISSSGETKFLLATVFCSLFVVFLPLVVFALLLHRHRDTLNNPSVRSWLGYLYASYQLPENQTPRLRYWYLLEIPFMLFRFLLGHV